MTGNEARQVQELVDVYLGSDGGRRRFSLYKGSYLLHVQRKGDSVSDWKELARKIHDQGQASAKTPGKRIWELLPRSARRIAKSVSGLGPQEAISPMDKSTLANAMNRAIEQEDFYEQSYGFTVTSRAETFLDSLAIRSSGEIQKLNRMLMQEAFEEVRPKPVGDDFEALVDYVRSEIDFEAAEDGLRVVTAACALGPAYDGLPPASDRERLLRVLRQHEPTSLRKRLDRVLEFAIAYGVGTWREPDSGRERWHTRWQGAVRALVRLARHSLEEVDRWCGQYVLCYPYLGRQALWGEGTELADWLYDPTEPLALSGCQALEMCCKDDGAVEAMMQAGAAAPECVETVRPGARWIFSTAGTGVTLSLPPRGNRSQGQLRFPAATKITVFAHDQQAEIRYPNKLKNVTFALRPDEACCLGPSGEAGLAIWKCTCGHEACARARHRLGAWSPKAATLWSFVASAVKGTDKGTRTGTLEQSMAGALFTRRKEGWRLRPVPVEYKVCTKKGCGAWKGGVFRPTEYEKGECPECGRPFDPATHTVRTRRRWILVDSPQQVYEDAQRVLCPGCETLYDPIPRAAAAAHCENCGKALFGRTAYRSLWRVADTLRRRARKVGDARSRLGICPSCGRSLEPPKWCPKCGSTTLPLRTTRVWRRLAGVRREQDDTIDTAENGRTDSWRTIQ